MLPGHDSVIRCRFTCQKAEFKTCVLPWLGLGRKANTWLDLGKDHIWDSNARFRSHKLQLHVKNIYFLSSQMWLEIVPVSM